MGRRGVLGMMCAAVVIVAACGGSDDSSAATSTTSAAPGTAADSSTTAAPTTEASPATVAPPDVAPIGERTLVDRPDDEPSLPKIQVLVTTPSDGPDDELDLADTLPGSIESAQRWLEDQTGRRLRYDTYEGALDIVFHRLPRSSDQYFDEGVFIRDAIEADLRAAGFDEADTMYVAYYAGPAEDCASGFAPETLPGNTVGIYWTHLDPAENPCYFEDFRRADEFAGTWELTLLHEVFHGLGAVGTCAPNHFEGHVGDFPDDLMYRGDQPWVPAAVDIDRDDYWGHGRDDCPDLARSTYLE